MIRLFLAVTFLLGTLPSVWAQETELPLPDRQLPNRTGRPGTQPGQRPPGTQDSLRFEQRDDLKDSINITFRYLDSTRRINIDSSINDFDGYYSMPAHYNNLGNNGAAAFPLIYSPRHEAGFDPGFHAYDVYRFALHETKIYRTTRPFSSLAYQLASGKEQMIQAMHTQNPRPNMNFGFDYRLISAPGLFVTQNTNHNNFRLYANYQGRRKRYNGTMVMLGNTIRASQNGGIINEDLLSDPNRKDRFSVPVHLGQDASYRTNPFVTSINTGVTYRDFTFFLRQSYDFGKRDSIALNDSITEHLFYPRLRVQHTLKLQTFNYRYFDALADSAVYYDWYGIEFPNQNPNAKDTFSLREKWNVITNDVSLVQYPDIKNTAQFLQVGITLENIKSVNQSPSFRFHNLMAHGEYRNRTRNRKWDMQLKGLLYVNGNNSGDYHAHARLSRSLNKRWGDVSLYFYNTNRSPAQLQDPQSPFNLGSNGGFNKENITTFGAESNNALFTLGFRNHLLANHIYFSSFTKAEQTSTPVNVMQGYLYKKMKLTKRINWYLDAAVQHSGNSPVKLPLVYTRNRLAFEGNFFKNLLLSTGFEVRYFTPYEANTYSPVIGQFVVQDTATIKNLPDISAFLHFRIRTFAGYIRAENLNTLNLANGFDFTKNNFAAPLYPTPGLLIRFGIRWWFVN